MIKKYFLFSVFSLAVATASAFSDSTAIELSEVKVTTTRSQVFRVAGQTLQELDSTQIHTSPVQSIDGLLKQIPGVDIRQRGTAGSQADISLRGGSFDQVLVLLNGVDVSDLQTGHHNLNLPVDIADLSSVVVLQGAGARRYGTQAFSGAVNLITQQPTRSGVRGQASYGSFNALHLGAGYSLVGKNIKHSASVSYRSNDGYRANTDLNQLQLYSLTKLETPSVGDWTLQLAHLEKSFGANGFYSLAYPNQFEHIQNHFASLSWKQQFDQLKLQAHINARRHYDRFELFRDFEGAAAWYADHNYHLTDMLSGDLQAEYTADWGKLSGGARLRNDHIFSTVLGVPLAAELIKNNPYESDKNFTRSAERRVAQLNLDYNKGWRNFLFSAGTTMLYNNTFGVQLNGGADISYIPIHELMLFASIQSASRLPTFTDLYYQSATQMANPNLIPERGTTAEVGGQFIKGSLQVQGAFFYRMGRDIIDWVKFPEEEKWVSMNHATLNTMGSELSLQYQFDNIALKHASLSYSFVHSDKQSGDFDSKYALDYLRHQLRLDIKQQLFSSVNLLWQFSYSDRAGTYTDFQSAELRPYDPFFIASLGAEWVRGPFRLYADLQNIFNAEHVDFGGLPLPGIHGNIGLKFNY